MKFWIIYAIKELFQSKLFSIFYILTLVLSTSGLTLTVFFGSEIKSQVENKAKNSLAADFSISARRTFVENEIKNIELEFQDQIVNKSHSYEFFAMLSYKDQARLVLVKVLDNEYPLYGSLGSVDERRLTGDSLKSGQIWLSKDAARALTISKSDTVKLGQAEFKYTEEINKDPTQTFRFGLLAPKVYIQLADLKLTNLIQNGSTFTEIFLYKIKSESIDLSGILKNKFTDPSIRFSNYKEASENANRQLNLLSDFLSLAALISFLVGLLGVYYINLNFFKQKSKSISLIKFMGASHKDVLKFIFIELILLLIVSVSLSSLVLYVFLPVAASFATTFVTLDLNNLQISKLFMISLVLNISAMILSIYPFLSSLKLVQPRALLSQSTESLINVKTKLFLTIVFVVLTLISLVQSRSVQFSLVFISSLLFAYICSFIPFLLFRFLPENKKVKYWKINFIIQNILSSKFAYQTLFAAMITAVMFSTALPLVKFNLEKELRPIENSKIPNLFLFDIQEEQKEPVENYLQSVSTESLLFSNMIRARIIKVNNENFERQEISSMATREEEADSRMRNRGINISVRDKLGPSERLVRGELWGDPSRAEVSVEERYMNRLGLKMNDKILFDIQGVELEAYVTSIRKVNWNSFSPNFFILFEPGFIDEAPKTYLTSLLTKTDKIAVQSKLFNMFPNISVIDFEATLSEALNILDSISLAFNFLALMTLLMGGLLLVLITATLVIDRMYQWSLLRALGAEGLTLGIIFAGEFTCLVILSLLLGFLLSGALVFGLTEYFFEAGFHIPIDFYSNYFLVSLILLFVFLTVLFKFLNAKKVLDVLKV
jgi:putative ABC transport system permease protein